MHCPAKVDFFCDLAHDVLLLSLFTKISCLFTLFVFLYSAICLFLIHKIYLFLEDSEVGEVSPSLDLV